MPGDRPIVNLIAQRHALYLMQTQDDAYAEIMRIWVNGLDGAEREALINYDQIVRAYVTDMQANHTHVQGEPTKH